MRVPGTHFTVEEAIDWIEFCRDQYYNYNNPPVSDIEYDFIVDATRAIIPSHTLFRNREEKIGSRIELKSQIHFPGQLHAVQDMQTGRFDLSKTFLALKKWMNEVSASSFSIRPVYDGIHCVLYYTRGYLTRALTCQNGLEGRNVTEHLKRVRGVPFLIPGKITCEVVGTVTMRNSQFMAFAPGQFLTPYSAIVGSLALKDYNLIEERKLDFCAWDVIVDNKKLAISEKEKITLLRYWNFQDTGSFFGITSIEDIKNLYIKLSTSRYQKNIGHPIFEDAKLGGIAVTVEDRKKQAELGYNQSVMNFSICLGFPIEAFQTTIKNVKLCVGKNGKITRHCFFSPIKFGNHQFSSAVVSPSLPLQMGVGSKIVVSKPCLVPFVANCLVIKNTTKTIDTASCPSCKSPLFYKNTELFCNNIDCQGRILAQLRHYTEVVLSGTGVDTQAIEKIYEAELVTSPADLYLIDKFTFLAIPGFGKTTANIIYAALGDSKLANLASLLYAISIPYIGRFWAKQISILLNDDGTLLLTPMITVFSCMLTLLKQKPEERVVPIGIFIKFAQWLCSQYGKQIIQDLRKAGMRVLMPGACKHSNIQLIGISGKIIFPKEELEIFLSKYGYCLASRITQRTAIIICNSGNPETTNKHAKVLPDVLLIFKLLNNHPLDIPYKALSQDVILSKRLVWELAVKNAIDMEKQRELF